MNNIFIIINYWYCIMAILFPEVESPVTISGFPVVSENGIQGPFQDFQGPSIHISRTINKEKVNG